jgi:hypothetical protein
MIVELERNWKEIIGPNKGIIHSSVGTEENVSQDGWCPGQH